MMVEMYAESNPYGREAPELTGFEENEGKWKLNLDYYRDFIKHVTGVEPTGELSPRKVKTIQSRLEGCVESYERSGSCVCDGFERYEHVDSIERVHEMSRFFRVLVNSYSG
jgi:hypothetical protein